MSSAQGKTNNNSTPGFTTVQAYTLAVITLAIGIAVGYFARGSATVTAVTRSRKPHSLRRLTVPAAWLRHNFLGSAPRNCRRQVRPR